VAKADVAVRHCEQGVIATAAHANARMEVGAVLANNDLPSLDDLAAKQFHA
jgi:hypothetical protein